MCERDSSEGGGVYGIGASLVLLAVGEEDTAVKVQTWQPARQPHDTASYLDSFPLHCGPSTRLSVSMMYEYCCIVGSKHLKFGLYSECILAIYSLVPRLQPSFNKKLGQIRK